MEGREMRVNKGVYVGLTRTFCQKYLEESILFELFYFIIFSLNHQDLKIVKLTQNSSNTMLGWRVEEGRGRGE